MSSRLADAIALTGFAFLIAGVYLALGLAAALILTGASMIYIAWRLPEDATRIKPKEDNHDVHSSTRA